MKKLVVITGASSGFGRAMAKRFHDEGHPVLLLARRIELLEELGLENALCEQVDVTDKEAFERAVRKAEDIYGPVDLLVNNAGVMLLGHVETQSADEWRRMMDVNVMGVLNGMQIVAEGMKQRRCGTIVNISSIAGVKPFTNHAAYCASKYGVVGLSEVVRQELSSYDVRVVRICPGSVETELLGHTTDEGCLSDYQDWREATGVGSITAEDIANTVHFVYSMPQGVNIREVQIADTRQDA
ncbi:MAG: SDR family oxidoreductase [Collinsella sp.]|nr:SDR family oxidoreductase [Collinsella sp.]